MQKKVSAFLGQIGEQMLQIAARLARWLPWSVNISSVRATPAAAPMVPVMLNTARVEERMAVDAARALLLFLRGT